MSTKIIKTKLFSFLILLIFLFPSFSFSQTEYNMTLAEVIVVAEDLIEFEVNITSANEIFILTSYQCSFIFNDDIANGGQLTFSYVDGTSQLTNPPSLAVGINNFDGETKLTFASWVGSDIIFEDSLIIGKFRLQNTTSFAVIDPNISWNFEGAASTMLTGELFQNITIPINFHYNSQSRFSSMFGKINKNREMPGEYELFQNYPNPFNPATKITFSLPKESNINLTVYNLLGQEIEILVNDRVDVGTHSVDFVGEGLPSGIYFCKLRVENKFLETIKMILLR